MDDVQIKRPLFTYKFDEADQLTFDGRKIETFSIAELTLKEERLASKLAPGDGLQEALVGQSLKKINGQPIGQDGEVERLMAVLRPRQRDFMVTAYRKHNAIKKDEADDFLKRAVVTTE